VVICSPETWTFLDRSQAPDETHLMVVYGTFELVLPARCKEASNAPLWVTQRVPTAPLSAGPCLPVVAVVFLLPLPPSGSPDGRDDLLHVADIASDVFPRDLLHGLNPLRGVLQAAQDCRNGNGRLSLMSCNHAKTSKFTSTRRPLLRCCSHQTPVNRGTIFGDMVLKSVKNHIMSPCCGAQRGGNGHDSGPPATVGDRPG
jgi:hypothetical protein